MSEEEYLQTKDSISKGKFVPEEKTDYIFVTTSIYLEEEDTIYTSK